MKDLRDNKLAIIAIIIAIIALVIACIRTEPIAIDWAGVAIGSLSILVTLLIGWNILATLDIKKTADEIKSYTNQTQEETMARAYTSIMNQTSYKVEGRTDDDDCYNAVANALFACKHYHRANKYSERDQLINIVISFKKEHCKLSTKNISDLTIILGHLRECGIDISTLESWINNIKQKDEKES